MALDSRAEVLPTATAEPVQCTGHELGHATCTPPHPMFALSRHLHGSGSDEPCQNFNSVTPFAWKRAGRRKTSIWRRCARSGFRDDWRGGGGDAGGNVTTRTRGGCRIKIKQKQELGFESSPDRARGGSHLADDAGQPLGWSSTYPLVCVVQWCLLPCQLSFYGLRF